MIEHIFASWDQFLDYSASSGTKNNFENFFAGTHLSVIHACQKEQKVSTLLYVETHFSPNSIIRLLSSSSHATAFY